MTAAVEIVTAAVTLPAVTTDSSADVLDGTRKPPVPRVLGAVPRHSATSACTVDVTDATEANTFDVEIKDAVLIVTTLPRAIDQCANV
jgi:hypothetical protein